eukprot:1330084-Pleurochrysis_carterae.AAC.1
MSASGRIAFMSMEDHLFSMGCTPFSRSCRQRKVAMSSARRQPSTKMRSAKLIARCRAVALPL